VGGPGRVPAAVEIRYELLESFCSRVCVRGFVVLLLLPPCRTPTRFQTGALKIAELFRGGIGLGTAAWYPGVLGIPGDTEFSACVHHEI
jgi:hypothetical protein